MLTAGAVAACADGLPTRPEINAAAGGNGGPAVAATDPNSAPQDTTLDVTVSGSGFDEGSQTQWAIAGVPASKVRTNSTRFVNSKRLIANVTIALDADTTLYDVIVTTASGKKGIGTELFQVIAKGHSLGPPVSVTFADGAGDNVISDGRGAYADGVCGVQANLNLGDLRLSPSGAWSGALRRTCGSPRAIALGFDDPVDGVTTDFPITGQATFLSIDKIELVTVDSGMVERKAQLNGTCNRLVFNPDEFPGTSRVLVTRTGANTWSVTAPAGAVAWCVGRGKAYRMPFNVTVQLK